MSLHFTQQRSCASADVYISIHRSAYEKVDTANFAQTAFSEVEALRYGIRTNMAVKHGAWTFDPVAFHRWLESWTVWEGELRLGALQELAKTVFADTSRITRRALEYLRMDEELLEDPGPDASLADHWYYCALASHLDPAPSLSTLRCPTGYYVLEIVLPLLGWSADEIRTLVYGRPMGSLAATYGSEAIAEEFGSSLNMERDRGWVDLAMAEELLSRLAMVEDHFYYPTPEILERVGRSSDPEWHSKGLLTTSHSDAQEMLQTVVKRERPLFLILD